MLCSILDGNSRINPEHQLSGLNQKTPKRTHFLASFLPSTNTLMELFEGAYEICFGLHLVSTFRYVEVGDAVLEDRLQILSIFFRFGRRTLEWGLATF